MSYLAKIFEDVTDNPSSKRWALFLFILLFFVITILVYFKAVDAVNIPFLQSAQDKLTDMIKFFGAFVASEQVTKFAKTGDQ